MYCERLEKLKQKGIDYRKFCKCNGSESGACTAITELEKTIDWLKGCYTPDMNHER